eukprot:1860069-Rhodomonas_salina.2
MPYRHISDLYTATHAKVSSDGRVSKSTPRRTKVGCPMNLVSFPFDYQSCSFTVGTHDVLSVLFVVWMALGRLLL